MTSVCYGSEWSSSANSVAKGAPRVQRVGRLSSPGARYERLYPLTYTAQLRAVEVRTRASPVDITQRPSRCAWAPAAREPVLNIGTRKDPDTWTPREVEALLAETFVRVMSLTTTVTDPVTV